jgi:adenine specific DNA methylase Mod
VAETGFQNKLQYGDNLDVMRENIASASVDLVYLDPPFNSNRSYNVIFGRHASTGNGAAAQIQAFDDTWHWTPTTEDQYGHYVAGGLPNPVADALTAFRTLLGENDAVRGATSDWRGKLSTSAACGPCRQARSTS